MDEYLLATLRALGVSEHASYATIASSGKSRDANREVYAKVNCLLEELIATTDLGESIHVTGELRALSDPLHQNVCIANFERNNTRIRFIGHIPMTVRDEPYRLLEQDIEAWRSSKKAQRATSWIDELTAFELAGDEIVEIHGTPDREALHYSVFPANYVLLQEPHDPKIDPAKRVWLLQSAEICQALRERSRVVFERAQRIPPAYFDRLPIYAASVQALELLAQLQEGVSRCEPERDAPWYRTIKSLGFVAENGTVSITDAGREYLKSFEASQ